MERVFNASRRLRLVSFDLCTSLASLRGDDSVEKVSSGIRHPGGSRGLDARFLRIALGIARCPAHDESTLGIARVYAKKDQHYEALSCLLYVAA
jgi:hypothetical protein